MNLSLWNTALALIGSSLLAAHASPYILVWYDLSKKSDVIQIKPQMIQTHQDSETKKFCAKRGFQLISICALNYTHDKHDDNNWLMGTNHQEPMPVLSWQILHPFLVVVNFLSYIWRREYEIKMLFFDLSDGARRGGRLERAAEYCISWQKMGEKRSYARGHRLEAHWADGWRDWAGGCSLPDPIVSYVGPGGLRLAQIRSSMLHSDRMPFA
jgi:hypothetical protein